MTHIVHSKHLFSVILGTLCVLGSLFFGVAKAQNTPDTPTTTPDTSTTTSTQESTRTPTNTPAPVVLDVDSNGNVLIRGTVTAVNSDSVIIDSWGGSWTIRMNNDGTVIPSDSAAPNSVSQVRVGDLIGAEGTISQNEDLTVEASFMRDWTTNPYPGGFDSERVMPDISDSAPDVTIPDTNTENNSPSLIPPVFPTIPSTSTQSDSSDDTLDDRDDISDTNDNPDDVAENDDSDETDSANDDNDTDNDESDDSDDEDDTNEDEDDESTDDDTNDENDL